MPGRAELTYISMIDAVAAQRQRLSLDSPRADRWSTSAERFRADPRREPEPNLRAIMEYIRPYHTVLDIGGGAGRYALPIALRCQEVINIEPASGMGAAFEASAKEAGIQNARWVETGWLESGEITGHVSLVVHVTYFVREIVPFLEKLARCSSERVIIATSVTPPPNQGAAMFEIINGEPLEPVPSFRELVPVLWDMGVVPDVHVLEDARATSLGGVFPTREDAVRAAIGASRLALPSADEIVKAVHEHFDERFIGVEGGFRQRASGDPRLLLITWPTSNR